MQKFLIFLFLMNGDTVPRAGQVEDLDTFGCLPSNFSEEQMCR